MTNVNICFVREGATGTSKLGEWARGGRHLERGGPWPPPADCESVGQEMAPSVTATPLGQGTKTHWHRRPNRGASHGAGFFLRIVLGGSQAAPTHPSADPYTDKEAQ